MLGQFDRGQVVAVGVLLGVALLPFAIQFLRAWFAPDDDDDQDQQPLDEEDHDQPGDAPNDGDDPREPLQDDALALHDLFAASEHFFALWLEPYMMLSSARFDVDVDDGEDLTIAQRRMMEGIATQLGLRPGMRLLVVESGWGEGCLYLARHYGVRVIGYSRHAEQVVAATRRAEAAGVDPNVVEFVHGEVAGELGTFDCIIRIALSEIGTPAPLALYLDLLKVGGKALVHEATSPPREPDMLPARINIRDPRFDVERLDVTKSFVRTVELWSASIDTQERQGHLVHVEEWTRGWQDLLRRYSTEVEDGARGLDQVMCTKRPPSTYLGGRASSRGVVRRLDSRVEASHLPAAT